MNFLQLCQALRREAGISGSGPSAVTGQTGQLEKIVEWIRQSWVEIQESRTDWLFMNASFSFSTVASTRDYTAAGKGISDLKSWDTRSFLIYDPDIGASDEGPLAYAQYPKWRDQFRAGMAARDAGRPTLFTLLPDNSVRFEPMPDGIYTISGEYKRKTQHFSAAGDEPTGLPEDYHMIIVWQGLQKFAAFYNAPELLDKGETNYDRLLFPLEHNQLPEMDLDFRSLA